MENLLLGFITGKRLNEVKSSYVNEPIYINTTKERVQRL